MEGRKEGERICLLLAVAPAEAGAVCPGGYRSIRGSSSRICRRVEPQVPVGWQHPNRAVGHRSLDRSSLLVEG